MRLYHVGVGAASVANAIKDTLTAGNVAISRNGARLIYSSAERIHNLVQLALDGSGTPTGAPARLTSTTGGDFAPQYSPDGKSILYGSRRFNEVGLWMTDIAAEHSSELTSSRQAIIAPGTWAPDGKSILFHDTSDHGVWQVYRMALDTRRITRLTFETGNSAIPTYSRDGNWIYFSSVHAGAFVLKRMAASGGPSTVIVGRSVEGAQESADGRWLYFSDSPSGGLWKMPMGGGEISRVLESIIVYALTRDAIYYWSGEARRLMLRRLDLKSGTDKVIFRPLRPAAPGLTATPDGRRLCYPEIQHDSQELLMLENWR